MQASIGSLIETTLANLPCRLKIVSEFVDELDSPLVENWQELLLLLEVLFSSSHYSEDLDSRQHGSRPLVKY